ncbi:THAP-type domain-containing protein [Nephila pilipes]|uniref:THAP-type domain-containing protein n=1 Tax=Nephila pilipes TaxID=299642 RepID=A0A8X6TRH9_NEPPI|nr:THAP-type domain-containing protein [Nephila pilipes]
MLRRDNFQPTPYSKIRSDHFNESCFKYQPFTNRIQLKPSSIPTIFVFSKATSCRRVLDKCLPTTSTEKEKESSKVGVGTQFVSFSDLLQIQIDLLPQKEAELKNLKTTLEEKEFVPETIKDDTKMKASTSFTRERIFYCFEFLIIETDLQKNTNRRPIDRFFLFFIKLKTGISNEFLSVLFGISDSTVSRDFNYVTSIMYERLNLLDIFATESMVIEYMPLPFRFGNKFIKIIVDCTEFPIQKPSSPIEQQLTFSRYKNTNSLKSMIGITPNGAIIFISPLYCGSISDKQLFVKSKL